MTATAPQAVQRAERAREDVSPSTKPDRLTERLIRTRWATVVPIVLPLSKAYDAYWTLRHVVVRNLRRDAAGHDARVAAIVEQVRGCKERGELVFTSRKAWQSVSTRALSYIRAARGVDVALHDILELDEARGSVTVEPRVNMAQLTRFLAPRGYTLPVVPELDDLTAGGLLLGYGIESSSHLYGLFADTVRSVEVVLGDGRVVRASPTENAELFYALPFSYGSLGIVTAIELPIVRATKTVRLTYTPVLGLDEICDAFRERVTRPDPPALIDALLFDRDRAVIVEGDFVEVPRSTPIHHIERFYEPWFYKHIESHLERGPRVEHVPLRAYYHRYTRSLYWHGELLVPFGNDPLFRYTLGWLMPPKVSFMRLTQTERLRAFRDEHNVTQDALIPIQHLREGIALFDRIFECYPLWLCAHRVFRTRPQGMLSPSQPGVDHEIFVDLGAWQVPGFVKRKEPFSGRRAVREMEAWLRAHHGYQCLYAVTEQTRDELWQMFDPTLYERVRREYGAEGVFMDVFDKVGRAR